jgi:hypothetical protein
MMRHVRPQFSARPAPPLCDLPGRLNHTDRAPLAVMCHASGQSTQR